MFCSIGHPGNIFPSQCFNISSWSTQFPIIMFNITILMDTFSHSDFWLPIWYICPSKYVQFFSSCLFIIYYLLMKKEESHNCEGKSWSFLLAEIYQWQHSTDFYRPGVCKRRKIVRTNVIWASFGRYVKALHLLNMYTGYSLVRAQLSWGCG